MTTPTSWQEILGVNALVDALSGDRSPYALAELCDYLNNETERAINMAEQETERSALQKDATDFFYNILLETKSSRLKAHLASHISGLNFYNPQDQNHAFSVNAACLLLKASQTTTTENTTNKIFDEVRFIFGEDNDARLNAKEATQYGNTLLSCIIPGMKNQTAQAHLLKQFTVISQAEKPFNIPRSLSQKAVQLLSDYQEQEITHLPQKPSKNALTHHWATLQVQADLSMIALNSRYLYR